MHAAEARRDLQVFKGKRVRRASALWQRGLAGSAALLVTLAVLVGAGLGVGGYTFVYAKGLSYMSSDPKVCINCHIMQPQYDGWQRSSHHAVAGCIDCHLPRDFIGKWIAKGLNGYSHGRAFTAQDFAEPIVIKGGNARILQRNCVSCHADLVHMPVTAAGGDDEVQCTHCHQTVGHGERAGLGGPRS